MLKRNGFGDEENFKTVKQAVIEFDVHFPVLDQKFRKIMLFASPSRCDLIVKVFSRRLLSPCVRHYVVLSQL